MQWDPTNVEVRGLRYHKLAHGHHYDDVIETTLLSILYSGQVQTMMPRLWSDNFEGMQLIRPMFFIREEDIVRFRDAHGLTFIRCACKFTEMPENTRGTGDSLSKRVEVKHLIAEMKKVNPSVEANIFRSMENVHLAAVLGYKTPDGLMHSFLDDPHL